MALGTHEIVTASRLVRFEGFEGIHLVADVWGDDRDWPVLLMHGGGDQSVSPLQSLRLAQALQERGAVYELVVYAEDGHTLPANRGDRDRRVVAWFERYGGPPARRGGGG